MVDPEEPVAMIRQAPGGGLRKRVPSNHDVQNNNNNNINNVKNPAITNTQMKEQQKEEELLDEPQELQMGNDDENQNNIPASKDDDDDQTDEEPPPPPPDDPNETEPNIPLDGKKTTDKPTTAPTMTKVKEKPISSATTTTTTTSTTSQTIHTKATQHTPSTDPKVLTLFLEPRHSLDESTQPLPVRQTRAEKLERHEFPSSSTSCTDGGFPQRLLPVNDFPDKDPYLPWIHDYFVSSDGQSVQFVAANRRRCETGQGKEIAMAFLLAVVSLFQPVAVAIVPNDNNNENNNTATNDPQRYRLAAPDDPNVVAAETRFQCRFHTKEGGAEYITFSRFPFNYEYVHWRKRGSTPMFAEMGPDIEHSELSQLLFSCPIPESLQSRHETNGDVSFWLDVIPIRTPPRKNTMLLTANHTGPDLLPEVKAFDASTNFGTQHILPLPNDAGRWANLPVCLPEKPQSLTKPHQMVACTWASASYHRRGDDSTFITDVGGRLREWLHFNRLVGMDHIYLYDNTPMDETTDMSPLEQIVKTEFADFVTYIPWPAKVCNNHKTKDKNPGERSSQYAAEASCLERFGSSTEWMTFLDVDEYLVPVNDELDWKPILAERENDSILSLRSSRGRARTDLMQELADSSECAAARIHFPKKATEPCVEPRSNETFLRVYNCDANPPPRPENFVKGKKEIVRPSFVLQHFVHNTTVTRPLATYYRDMQSTTTTTFTRELPISDTFVNEETEGFLLHAKTVPPPETMMRSHHCQAGSTAPCPMGYVCPSTTAVNATLQRNNLLQGDRGQFCNCWVHPVVEHKILPKLETLLGRKAER